MLLRYQAKLNFTLNKGKLRIQKDRFRLLKKIITKYLWILLFLIFAGVNILQNKNIKIKPVNFAKENYYERGILKSYVQKVNDVADYYFNAALNPKTAYASVEEKIIWRNKTNFPARELQFHLYANAYSSSKTLFNSVYKVTKAARTHFEISEVKVNGKEKRLIYFQPDVKNPYDSTVAKIKLQKAVNPGDSAVINFKYKLKISESIKRFGRARGTDFFFISQWFPKIAVFQEGKWNCHQYFPSLNFFSDFGYYNVKIKIPVSFKAAATGRLVSLNNDGDFKRYEFEQFGVHDFAWTAAREIIDTTKFFVRQDGSKLKVKLFVQPTSVKYINRFFTAIFKSLKFYENNIGDYPYETLTMVDVPRTSRSGGMEYPTLFTVSAGLFSPVVTHSPEKLVVHEFTHQYFYGLIANNETEEAWLDEGFTSYFASKIIEKNYKPGLVTFRFLNYIPVPGINYLSFKDIPIIYTLGFYRYPEYARALSRYYSNLTVGAIADTSYKLPTRLSYVVNSYSKPEIMLYTLERLLGEKKFFSIIKKYFNEFEFKHPTSRGFFDLLFASTQKDLSWIKKEVFESSKIFDDAIRYLKKTAPNSYELFLERKGGYFPHTVYVYTTKDTLRFDWKEKKNFKIIKFRTKNKVIAADIDPKRINLLDINFANNSYTMNPTYTGRISLSVKWFFWLQNALMILGSVG